VVSILLSCPAGRPGTRPGTGWRGGVVTVAAAVTLAVTGSAVVTGCSGQSAGSRGSVTSCAQDATNAIRGHVTVTTVPAACRGLSQVDVNEAVARALHAAAAGVRGRAGERRLIARDSQYLAGLVRAVPRARQSPAPVTAAVVSPSGTALGWAALVAWLVAAGLGLAMMVRWVTRPAQARDGGRAPVLNYTHLGLAVAALLTWTGYLASGVTALAWTACGLLLPVAGLGMALVFLGPSRDAATAPDITGLSTAGLSTGGPATRRPGALIIAAHIAAASVTILLAVLAAIGSG